MGFKDSLKSKYCQMVDSIKMSFVEKRDFRCIVKLSKLSYFMFQFVLKELHYKSCTEERFLTRALPCIWSASSQLSLSEIKVRLSPQAQPTGSSIDCLNQPEAARRDCSPSSAAHHILLSPPIAMPNVFKLIIRAWSRTPPCSSRHLRTALPHYCP